MMSLRRSPWIRQFQDGGRELEEERFTHIGLRAATKRHRASLRELKSEALELKGLFLRRLEMGRDRDEGRRASAAHMIEEIRGQARDLRGLYSARLKQASRLTPRRSARPGSPVPLRQPDRVRRGRSGSGGGRKFGPADRREKAPVGTLTRVFLKRLDMGGGLMQNVPGEPRAY